MKAKAFLGALGRCRPEVRGRLVTRVLALATAVILAAAPIGAAAPDFSALKIQPYEPPKPAPVFSLSDLSGKTWSLAEARGKVVLLFFWASW